MFKKIKDAVSKQFEIMKQYPLYRTDVPKDLLWEMYLDSFPPGSNPVFKERTEHDCSACRSFIKSVGSAVAIKDNKLISLWDGEVDEPYKTVCSEMSAFVKMANIRNILLHDQRVVGVDENHQDTDQGVVTWGHFCITLPEECVVVDRGSVYSDKKSGRDVFARALGEISVDDIETVLDLIDQGSLYRGEEHRHAVREFLKQKQEWVGLSHKEQDLFTWRQDLGPAVLRIRNSAIGTLLVDISKGEDLDKAVRSFESKVAPQNYKRPTAVVTKTMIENARKKVEELGFGSALGRRFAVPSDISVNDILFVDRSVRKSLIDNISGESANGDIFDELISDTKFNSKSLEKVEKVSIESFLENVLPKATKLELMFENRHSGNLVNLVAPRDPDAKHMFKWGNNFSWSYQGDLADSIKERVKKQGGSVTGDLRASLGWFNSDDLDLHIIEPGGVHIHYGMKKSKMTGGELDVDMNVNSSGPRASRSAVENITYPSRVKMLEGPYELFVENFTHRESKDVGFELELEFDGVIHRFAYDREVRNKQSVTVVKFNYSHKDGMKIVSSLPSEQASKVVWGIKTHSFHPVSMVMLSPNHWNGRPVGNRHWFFMLEKCKREGSSRGFFNEYLKDDLREHRKVFELLGSKMRTEEEGEQLSGLGFSSTQRNNVYAKVSGSFNRTINITF